MYSPKISEKIIPELYRLARERKIPMTKLTDILLADALKRETGFTADVCVRERRKDNSYSTRIFRIMKQQNKRKEVMASGCREKELLENGS